MTSVGRRRAHPLILHIDDDKASRHAVSRVLRQAGFGVVEGATGREALEKVLEKPDLIVLDVRLPDISGVEVCRAIKADPATAVVPVLHLSAGSTTGDHKAAGLDAGADAYLVRPVEPIELIATINALLRQRRTEEALRASEARYRLLVETVHDYAMLTLSVDGGITSWNPGAERATGYAERDVIGHPVSMLFDAAHAAAVRGDLKIAATEGRAPGERWLIRRDGRRSFVNGVMTAMRDDARRLIGFSLVMRDVTLERQAEAALQASEARFRLMADSAPVLIWICDTSKGGTWFNKPWLEFVGRPMQQEIGNGWLANVHTDDRDRVVTTFSKHFDARTLFAVEYRLRRHDGEFRWVIDRGVPTFNGHEGSFSGFIGTCVDITDRQRAEATLAESEAKFRQLAEERTRLLERERRAREDAEEANRLKDEFLATLSHELRTPLNAIVGWAMILRRTKAVDEHLADGLATIERNAKVQAQLIDDLLDVSRIISGQLQLEVGRVDLASIVETAIASVHPASEAKDIRMQRVLASDGSIVMGDPGRLQQVVWNLLTNAIKFTPRGGRVAVTLARGNSQVEVAVADSGKGIKREFLPYVFDRFRQADPSTTRTYGGLGLGLAIVRHLVELHGGTVSVESEGEDKGARFTVRLPLTAVKARMRPDPERTSSVWARTANAVLLAAEPLLAGVRVLVVDDEADSRRVLAQVLEDRHADVETAPSVAEAVERLRHERYDVIVSDVGMPAQSGYELMQWVRALPPEAGGATPALALTAFARAEDRRRALLAGFQAHLSKPVDPSELVAAVASAAGRTGRSRSEAG